MTNLALDPDKSRVRLHTFAEGLFARLAHDLELECRGLSGTAERLAEDKGTATVEAPIARIEVAGTLKDGRVDPRGLSASDHEDVLAKMKKDVFHTGDGVVRVEATLEFDTVDAGVLSARRLESGKARVRVVPPNGRAAERSIPVRIESDASATRVSGTLPISLSAIGGGTVKGPMNAFRVKDTVEVLFDLVFHAG